MELAALYTPAVPRCHIERYRDWHHPSSDAGKIGKIPEDLAAFERNIRVVRDRLGPIFLSVGRGAAMRARDAKSVPFAAAAAVKGRQSDAAARACGFFKRRGPTADNGRWKAERADDFSARKSAASPFPVASPGKETPLCGCRSISGRAPTLPACEYAACQNIFSSSPQSALRVRRQVRDLKHFRAWIP